MELKQMNTTRRTTNGFTLVELMTTLAIGALLVTVAVPSFNSMLANNRISQLANEFVFAINYGRSEAAKLNQRVVMCYSEDPTAAAPVCNGAVGTNPPGWLLFATADGGLAFNSADNNFTLLRVGTTPNMNIQIRTNATLNDGLEINANGSTNEGGNTAILAICDDRDGDGNFDEIFGRQIQIQPSGHVQMVTSPIPDCANPTT